MDLGAPPVLPVLRLPEPPLLPRPVLEVPRATLPAYKPLVVPPSDLRAPPGVKGTTESDKKKEEKPKDNVESLPPTSFDLYNFKTFYVNHEDKGGAAVD